MLIRSERPGLSSKYSCLRSDDVEVYDQLTASSSYNCLQRICAANCAMQTKCCERGGRALCRRMSLADHLTSANVAIPLFVFEVILAAADTSLSWDD